MIARFKGSRRIAILNVAILHDAAVCELDGPLITGPITSLKTPGKYLIILRLYYS